MIKFNLVTPDWVTILTARGLSQATLADQLGIKHPYISQWLRGRYIPEADKLKLDEYFEQT